MNKWVIGVVAVLAVAWGAATLLRDSTGLQPLPGAVMDAPTAPPASQGRSEPPTDSTSQALAKKPEIPAETETVINIGEPMDPDDPSTWPQSTSTEVVNIGPAMDPDDPSTWPQDTNTEVINIGEPMDPDDPSTWSQATTTEVVNIGQPMNPDAPYTWPTSESNEVINIGEPMDPGAPPRR